MIVTCRHPWCDRTVKPGILACKTHWLALPKALRDAVWRAWRGIEEGRVGAVTAHEAAVDACVRWWERNPS